MVEAYKTRSIEGSYGMLKENRKRERRRHTEFGEDLSWEYLCYVREHPVSWNVPKDILYGSGDNLTSIETMTVFAQTHHVSLTEEPLGTHIHLDTYNSLKEGSSELILETI